MQFRKKTLGKSIALILGAMLSVGAGQVVADDEYERRDYSGSYSGSYSSYDSKKFTLIHIGDIHGHTTPRANVRSDGDGRMEGGLARMYTRIKQIREDNRYTLTVNTGDTIQGSGEALYSKGQALVDVLDMFGINAYTPGNWDFVYGPDRFKELFTTVDSYGNPKAKRWGGLVANVYETDASAPKRPSSIGSEQDSNVSQAEMDAYASWYLANGKRILPATSVKSINGVKVGFIGCTTSRGPQVVGSWVTAGLEFTDCSREVPYFAEQLRNEQKVDMVVLISEIEIGRNIQLMKELTDANHVDVVLNSDMHEETIEPIVVTRAGSDKKTLIIEEGQDGTMIGELNVSFANGQVNFNFKPHRIHDGIRANEDVAEKVAQVRAPYTSNFDLIKKYPSLREKYHKNFFSGSYLNGRLDQVVGYTDVDLHRSNYSDENMPAVIEGSSHDFIADAIRWWAKSDLATVRGFRYGTHVRGSVNDGKIRREDLFHYVPIGARVAKVSRISANQLRNQVDNSSRAVFSSNPGDERIIQPRYNNANYAPGGSLAGTSPGAGFPAYGLAGSPEGWGGGWLFAYSAEGFKLNFAPFFKPNWTENADNTFSLTPPTNTSRARGLTVSVLCKQLPPVEIASTGCSTTDTNTRYSTVITEETTGVYKPNWKANYAAGTTYTPYLLNPDGWQYLNGTPNQPNTTNTVNQHFKAGLFTVAGYFYAQSPNTVNNCNNCYPTGTVPGILRDSATGDITDNMIVDGLLNPNVAYLLPVNAKPDGTPSLDANGNPIVETEADGSVVWIEDVNDPMYGKPKVAGNPIDLTVIIEKYLASMSGKRLTADKLPLNRITVVNNEGTGPVVLPTTVGLRTMQPLCGTIGQDQNNPTVCP